MLALNIAEKGFPIAVWNRTTSVTHQFKAEAGMLAPMITPCETLADLVAADRLDLANALADAGQSLYPDSEDILAICALLAEIQRDWTAAEDLLRQLVDKQGATTTAFTWRHLIRVLRCQCEPGKALQMAQKAIAAYPEDDILRDEFLSLQELVSEQMPVAASTRLH